MYMYIGARETPADGAHTDSRYAYMRPWFQARDIIEKMASEGSGASSVFSCENYNDNFNQF